MQLSIIIPVYNSSKIIPLLVKKIKSNISKKIKKYEIIMINDASKDNSWDIIKKISKFNKSIKGINLKRNFGQHTAIFVGLKFAKGRKIITMDDDMQHSPNYILKIYNALDENDLCYSIYTKRQHGFLRNFISYINNLLASILFNKSIKVYLSSYRGFRSNIKTNVLKYSGGLIFIDSLLLKNSKKIGLVKVKHEKRHSGQSTYNIKALFSLWFDMIISYHFLPIRIGSFVGAIATFFVLIIKFSSINKLKKFEIKSKTF